MNLSIQIDRVVKKLDERLICNHVGVEALRQLIEMYRKEPPDIRAAVDLRSYLTLQVARYKAQEISRPQLLSNLEAAREPSRVVA
jgi:hypothetical protein